MRFALDARSFLAHGVRVQGFADVDPWLDGTLRFGGGYSTWSPPSSPVMAEVCPAKHICMQRKVWVQMRSDATDSFMRMLARCLVPGIAGAGACWKSCIRF